jgi:ferrous iron transport protein B
VPLESETATATTTPTVLFVGNPNTGKSTLFGALSGGRVRVGNYPGVTVETAIGATTLEGRRWNLVDLPGTYSLAPRAPDEAVAADVLLGRRAGMPTATVVLCVADASNLERNLYLIGQVLELGRPTVVALTMTDVAHARGIEVDADRLAKALGVPVVPVRGDRRIGLDTLKTALASVGGTPPHESLFPAEFNAEVDRLSAAWPAYEPQNAAPPRYFVERLLLDDDGHVERQVLAGANHRLRDELRASRARLEAAGCKVPEIETSVRHDWVSRVSAGVVTHKHGASHDVVGDRLDAVLTHRVWGSLVLAAVMILMFSAVFNWAEAPMNWIESGVAAVAGFIQEHMYEGALRSLLADGVVGGIGAVIVFLPQIAILFFLLSLLEECGYLTRAALLMDRVMSRLGLSGKSFIPLLSSFACAIPGVMAARVIENRRDRLTTIFVAPLMSCSARLPVYTLMTAAFVPARFYLRGLVGLQGLTLFGMYMVGIVVAAGTALVLKRTALKGETPPFVMELPPYRWPSPGVVIHRVVERAWDFLHSAGTQILAVSIIMWAALYWPRLPAREAAPLIAQSQRLRAEADAATAAGDTKKAEALESEIVRADNHRDGAQRRQSILGRAGHWIEPAVRPLGWDWRIGSAVLASFPAREVVVASLGVVFEAGAIDDDGDKRLHVALRDARWEGTNRPLFNTPVALSVMVFFALCAQCVSTLAVMRRETGGWTWPALSFVYMTTLAYLAALIVYQVGMRL